MLSCRIEPMLLVQASNVFAIAKRLIERVNYPAINDFNICNIGLIDCTCVGGLAAFIWMENDRVGSNFEVGDCFNFNFGFGKLGIRPI